MAYTGTDIEDLDATKPDGTTEAPSVIDNAIREAKKVLKNQFAVVSKTNADSPYSAVSTDSIILCNATAGAITINLPAVADVSSSSYTKKYIIIKTDNSANAITVDGDGAETIDGSTTATVSDQYEVLIIAADGTEWFAIKKVTEESTTTASSGSQAIAGGATWTPSAGVYQVSSTQCGLQIFESGTWRPTIATLYLAQGVIYTDGSKMRLKNTGGGSDTVYYQTF